MIFCLCCPCLVPVRIFLGTQKLIIKLIMIYYNQMNRQITKQELEDIIPKGSNKSVKGGNGIVGIVGGSFQYTGAPYFSAMAALRIGADLAHIFCSKDAAIPIKSYSPDVIVHPIFDYEGDESQEMSEEELEKKTDKWIKKIAQKFEKITSWVVGPGLGRSKHHKIFIPKLIKAFPKKTNLVIDADGLYFLCQFPQLMKDLKQLNCVLTPNHTEFKHLNKFLNLSQKQINQKANQTSDQSITEFDFVNSLNVTLMIKQQKQLILHSNSKLVVINCKGGKKRCGGIGDILSGCIAASIFWNFQKGPIFASIIVRKMSYQADDIYGQSLIASDILEIFKDFMPRIDQKQQI